MTEAEDIKKILEKEYKIATDSTEKKEIIKQILRGISVFLWETNTKQIEELAEAKREMVEIKERAQSQFDESKKEAAKDIKRAKAETKRKLQTTRDKLVGISETAFYLGEQINLPGQPDKMVAAINNIISMANIISSELEALGFWDTDEPKPRNTSVELALKSVLKEETDFKVGGGLAEATDETAVTTGEVEATDETAITTEESAVTDESGSVNKKKTRGRKSKNSQNSNSKMDKLFVI